MPEERRGLIDDQLSHLLWDFFNRIDQVQMHASASSPFETISRRETQTVEIIGDKTLSMKELSKLSGVKSSTLTQITDKLVKKQCLERSLSDKDRRIVLVKLTNKGLRIWRGQMDAKRQTIEAILGTLQFEEQVALLNLLTKIKGKGALPQRVQEL
jgi:DNA-binding MarR family transcriptional regulator